MASILYINWNIDPEFFRIGGFALRYYSILFMLAFVFSYWLMYLFFKKEKVATDTLSALTIYIFLGTLIGARLGHTLIYEFDYYRNHILEIILPFQINSKGVYEWTGYQGLASHGGAVGILAALGLYSKKYKQSFLWLLDRLVIVVALSAFFIRIGNLFNSEIIGNPTKVNWAFVFEKADMIPRHPAQLYEAVLYLIAFFMLWMVYKKHSKSFQNGYLSGYFLIMIFSIRFFVEFFKADQEAFESQWLLNLGQLLSIPFILLGICLVVLKSKPSENNNRINKESISI